MGLSDLEDGLLTGFPTTDRSVIAMIVGVRR